MQTSLTDGVLWYLVFLLSTTCHEFAHAWSAWKMGDDTAFRAGQVSLNPWPHLRRSPVGMVIVPIASWLLGGWIIGWASAPFNPQWAERHPSRMGGMAAAGPAANFCLAIGAALLIRLGLEWNRFAVPFRVTPGWIVVSDFPGLWVFAAHALSIVCSLNLLLGIFNLLPVPPLDGSCLPLLVLSKGAAATYQDLIRSPMVRLVGLYLIFNSSSYWLGPVLRATADLLYTGISRV